MTVRENIVYQIQLRDFEGPLDLLLFFIQRDELDVYDIPIARITDEYLEYVRYLSEIDLDGAGDFIYMAAVLIGIKARMLLPRNEVDEEGEFIDPRQELVDRLLEYVRYKEASNHLGARQEDRANMFVRGMASADRELFDSSLEVTFQVSIFELVSALRRVVEEADSEQVSHEIEVFEFSIEEQQRYVLNCLNSERTVSFFEMVRARPKQFVIVTFLAVLELARSGALYITTGGNEPEFYLTLRESGNT